MAGAAFGDIVHAIAPHAGGSAGAYALVGMGGVFAGAARAPITAVVIMFELTGEYTIILPLMLAIVLAAGVSHSSPTIPSIPASCCAAASISTSLRTRPYAAFRVSVMTPPPNGVRSNATIRSAADRFATGRESTLPVADGSGRYLGTLAAHDVMDAFAAGETTEVTALTRGIEPLSPTPPSGRR